MIEKLQKIYSEMTGDYDTIIGPKTKIDKNLNLTSFGKVQFICCLEEEFDIQIPSSEIRKFKTVKDIADYLEKQKKN
ncbi:MAG: phosphopantetheine-binding protein [Clostridia bacterium]|nr:phosphopantetheine-binding protein [Clostridia bacterium]